MRASSHFNYRQHFTRVEGRVKSPWFSIVKADLALWRVLHSSQITDVQLNFQEPTCQPHLVISPEDMMHNTTDIW